MVNLSAIQMPQLLSTIQTMIWTADKGIVRQPNLWYSGDPNNEHLNNENIWTMNFYLSGIQMFGIQMVVWYSDHHSAIGLLTIQIQD